MIYNNEKTVWIPEEFTDLNNYIKEMNKNRFAGNKCKQDNTNKAIKYFVDKKPITEYPVHITYIWHLPNKRKDPSNIAMSIKFIEDGMVKAGYIRNDGQKEIASIKHEFRHDDLIGVAVIINSSTSNNKKIDEI